jgi:hypothetical protein
VSLAIVGLLLTDLVEVRSLGAAHPVFGAFLDAGSCGAVSDVGTGPQSLEDLLGLGFDAAATESGLSPRRGRWPCLPGEQGASELTIFAPRPAGEADEACLENWHLWLSAGSSLSFVLAAASGGSAPIWVLCGHRLPAMGEVGTCSRADLWATWLKIAGASRPDGRFLLDEPPAELDGPGAAALTDRLRQLYGE